jgi:hypothetical protein
VDASDFASVDTYLRGLDKTRDAFIAQARERLVQRLPGIFMNRQLMKVSGFDAADFEAKEPTWAEQLKTEARRFRFDAAARAVLAKAKS